MIKYIHHQPGQSVYDLCNQAYGTLDLLVRFCTDNNITDTGNITEGAMYQYDTDLVQFAGTRPAYATEPVTAGATCAAVTGLAVSDIDYNSLTFSWTPSPAALYEYAYNTSGTEPTSGTLTTSTVRVLTGLTEMTTYHFFVRSVCSDGSYSAWVGLAEATVYAPPAPPWDTHIIASFFADDGPLLSGSDVTAWTDISGTGNDVVDSGVYPTYVPVGIGGLPSVQFNGTDDLITGAGMIGISGLSSISAFIVVEVPEPVTTYPAWSMASDPSLLVAGEVSSFLQMPAMTPEFSMLTRGNVGLNSGTLTLPADTPKVIDYVVDFTESLGNEQIMYKNNSSADYTPGASNDNSSAFISSPLRFGGFVGKLSALIIYDKKLNNTERAAVFTYLQTRYSIV